MDEFQQSRPFNRRIFLAGGASVVLAKGLFADGALAAVADTGTWTAGVVQASPSAGSLSLTEMPLETHRLVQVEMSSATAIHADLATGNTVVVQGDAAADGAIAADRVIGLVVGNASQLATSR